MSGRPREFLTHRGHGGVGESLPVAGRGQAPALHEACGRV